MDKACPRAILAAVSENNISELRAMLESIGYTVSATASNGNAALECVRSTLPDLVLAEAVLPGLDGPMLAERIFSMPLSRYPAVILTALPGSRVPIQESIRNSGCTVIEKPVIREKLANILPALIPERRRLSAERMRILEKMLDDLGIPDHRGKDYLIRAVSLAWFDGRYAHSLKGRIYPVISEEFGAASARVERSLRYVIDYAWRTGEIEKQHKIFGDTIDARRGKPTCGEMIARLADILRWEGRQ